MACRFELYTFLLKCVMCTSMWCDLYKKARSYGICQPNTFDGFQAAQELDLANHLIAQRLVCISKPRKKRNLLALSTSYKIVLIDISIRLRISLCFNTLLVYSLSHQENKSSDIRALKHLGYFISWSAVLLKFFIQLSIFLPLWISLEPYLDKFGLLISDWDWLCCVPINRREYSRLWKFISH